MNYGQKCLLCSREASTGLQVMGCLICFRCEKRLLSGLHPAPAREERLRLNRLYNRRQRTGITTFHI